MALKPGRVLFLCLLLGVAAISRFGQPVFRAASARPKCGHSFVMDRRFEMDLAPSSATLTLDRAPSAQATVRLILQLYQKAGPTVGCRLVDPSTALTLAGARALTAWTGRFENPTDDDVQALERLDKWLVPRGISLELCREDDTDVYEFSVVNLVGLERVSRSTHIAGFRPYHAETGWTGYYEWQDATMKSLVKHAPVPGNEAHVLYGVLLGYPDRAILDYLRADRTSHDRFISSDIPWTTYYECGVASFSFPPHDCDHPQIVSTEREWGQLLEAIYTAPDMRRLDADPEFRDARRALLRSFASKATEGWWSNERERLGILSPENTQTARFCRATNLTDSHERVLRLCAHDLAGMLRAGATPESIVARCREVALHHGVQCELSLYTIEKWIARARENPDDLAREIYEAAVDMRPTWCRRAL